MHEALRTDPSERPNNHVIEIVEVDRLDPGRSPADGFARAVRDARAPLVIVARAGVRLGIGGSAAAQIAAVMQARPAVAAIGLTLGAAGPPGDGIELLGEDDVAPRWPAAVALDVRRTRTALPKITDPRDDPWLWVLDQLSRSPGQVMWASLGCDAPSEVPRVRPNVIPALDPSLGDPVTAAGRPLPVDPGAVINGPWRPLWAAEGPSRALVVGGARPSAAWRMLGRVLAKPIDGATPLRLTASGYPLPPEADGPVAAWLPSEALPGSVALMLFDEGGELSLDHASDGDDRRRPVLLLGWAMAPLLSADALGVPPPPDSVPAGNTGLPVHLHRCERPDTRGVFVDRDGVIRGQPGPTTTLAGFAAARSLPGMAPLIDDRVVIGYARPATRLGMRTPVDVARPPVENRSFARRARSRVGTEVRVRRAEANKLLIVMPWMTVGGADVFIRDLARDLGAFGVEPHVVLTYPRDESPPDDTGSLRPVVRSLTCAPDDHPGEPLAEVVNRIGRQQRIGTMMVCGGWQVYEALPGLRSALPGTRVLDVLFNDFGHIDNNRRYAPWIDVTVCAFPGLQDLLVGGYGEEPTRTRTIFIGIDTTRFVPAPAARKEELRAQMGVDPGRPLWGYAGRVSPEKCLPTLIEALAKMGDAVPAQILIQGDGPAERDVAEAIAATGVEVLRRGFQPDPLPALQAMDAYLLPSRVEGIPLAIMEAAACGALPVATAVGGVPDLVRPGFSGYLAAPDDPGALAAALLALAGTPPWLASEMAANARAIVRRRMTWAQTVREYAALIYEE